MPAFPPFYERNKIRRKRSFFFSFDAALSLNDRAVSFCIFHFSYKTFSTLITACF
jgi:hypothetical protein